MRPVATLALLSMLAIPTTPALADGAPVVSADTIDAILQALVLDDTEGRDNLTPGGELARDRLISWLTPLPVRPAGSSAGSFEQPFDAGVNLLAVYSPPGTEGQAPVVMLGAHYDHVGYKCTARSEAVSAVCNGAADNAAGVAAALAAFESLVGKVDKPVAIALWDAEENGKLGSEYFAANPSIDMSAMRLYINFDIIGLNLFRGGESVHFVVGSETGGQALAADVDASAQGLPILADRISYALGKGRSDMDSFVDAGYPFPFVFLTEGDGSVYHTTADELGYLNLEKVEASSSLAARLAARSVAGVGYTHVPPSSSPLPIFADAGPIRDTLRLLSRNARANGLSSTQRAEVAARVQQLDRIVLAGESRYTQANAAAVAAAALYALDLSASLPFVP